MPEQAPVTSITVWELYTGDGNCHPQEYVGADNVSIDDNRALHLVGPAGRIAVVAAGHWVRYRFNRDQPIVTLTSGRLVTGSSSWKCDAGCGDTETATDADLTVALDAPAPGPRLEYVHADGTRTEIDTADLSELPARERAMAKTLVREARLNLNKPPKPKQPTV